MQEAYFRKVGPAGLHGQIQMGPEGNKHRGFGQLRCEFFREEGCLHALPVLKTTKEDGRVCNEALKVRPPLCLHPQGYRDAAICFASSQYLLHPSLARPDSAGPARPDIKRNIA